MSAPRFALGEDEEAGRAAAAAIAARHRPAAAGTPLSRDALLALFAELAPLGYLQSVLPDASGKRLSHLAFGALVEGVAPDLTLLGNHSVQRYIAAFGSLAQQERLLPPLLAGQSIAGIAISEPGIGADLKAMKTVARHDGRGYRLSGRKHWVTHGMTADLFVVLAQSEAGLTRFLVSADTPGLTRVAQPTGGLTHLTFAELVFEDCRLEPDRLFGGAGEGGAGAKQAFPIARLLAGLQALQLAEGGLDQVLTYAQDHSVFGRSLAEMDIVRHESARFASEIAAARLLCYQGLAAGAEDSGEAAGAKALATGLALRCLAWCQEAMGATALAAGHPLQRLARDAEMMAVVDGTAVLNRFVQGRRLTKRFE